MNIATLACGVLTVVTCAAAQAEPPAESAQPAAETGALEEIVVTAQKRSEKLLDVPISISSVSPSDLKESASKNLEELQGIVPGITIPGATAYGGSTIAIRGTSGAGTFLEDDPVAVYIDGIYQTSNSRAGTAALMDIASLEVVRGPQGTLQGRNATAGAILINTMDPGDHFDGFVRASLADPLEWRSEGAVSLPIAATLRVRLSGDFFNQRGWARNLYDDGRLGGERSGSGRAVLLWQPSDNFRARLSFNFQKLVNNPALQRWSATAVNPTGVAENLASPTPFLPLPSGLQSYYLDHNQVYNAVPSINTQNLSYGALELHYDFGPAEVVSLTGLGRHTNTGQNDSDGLGPVGTNGVSVIDSVTGEYRRAWNTALITGDQVTEELRVQSVGQTRFKWLAGAFFSRATDDMRFDILDYNLASSPPGDADVGFVAHQIDASQAGFADATFNITDALSITGGVRYTSEQKRFNNDFSVAVPEISLVVVGPIPYAPPQASWVDTSYRANIQYKLTDDTHVYVSTSRGFKSGGFNAFGVGPTPKYDPEYLYSTELGTKSYFLERRGYVAASGYFNNYDNLQVTAGVPTGGVNIYNAAKARIYGFELEGQFKLDERLSGKANMAYTRAYYTQFANGQGVDGNLVNATGNPLPNSPRWQLYLQGDYTAPLAADWTSHLQLSYRWRDKVYFFGTNLQQNLSGAPDGELGARLDFTYAPASLTASLFGRNLTDRRVVIAEQAFFAYPAAYFNEPRVVGIQVEKEF
jgi:iron complex outermembrane recepter protein